MRSILEANPKALEEMDAVTGNSVLHNAKYKKPLLALLQLKVGAFLTYYKKEGYYSRISLWLFIQIPFQMETKRASGPSLRKMAAVS